MTVSYFCLNKSQFASFSLAKNKSKKFYYYYDKKYWSVPRFIEDESTTPSSQLSINNSKKAFNKFNKSSNSNSNTKNYKKSYHSNFLNLTIKEFKKKQSNVVKFKKFNKFNLKSLESKKLRRGNSKKNVKFLLLQKKKFDIFFRDAEVKDLLTFKKSAEHKKIVQKATKFFFRRLRKNYYRLVQPYVGKSILSRNVHSYEIVLQ